MYKFLIVIFLVVCVTTCSSDKYDLLEPAQIPKAVTYTVSYHDEVRPIIEKKCLACHGCFDAPCQLKLESASGLLRGAHHEEVYDGKRTEAQSPTRLGIDANDEAEWRKLGFNSVLNQTDEKKSLLYNMLALGKTYPLSANKRIPDSIKLGIRRENMCVTDNDFASYAKEHPLEGMPLAVASLTDTEFSVIAGWLEQGAQFDSKHIKLTGKDLEAIAEWEVFFNQSSNKSQLVARWLYEHLFLAHIYFDETAKEPQFFELVRSFSAPGRPIEVVNTRLPNNAPEKTFYYRLRAIEGAIVHKRHITFKLDKKLRQRIEALFFKNDWSVSKLPGYEYEQRANPFITFTDIPAYARYQFMLEHAEYFTRTFIRGPVCRGQIATDVIRDHFWVMFQDPERDLFITDKKYHDQVAPLLGLPGQNDDLLKTGKNWDKYKAKRNQYHLNRNENYRGFSPEWASRSSIWDGEGDNQNALLTVFRHFDSASVQKGFIGDIPETIWWMDYPLFERTYYELVVNFDVFGNVAHQLQTRMYFDLIRSGAEYNFLRLLPPDKRQEILNEWYSGLGKLKTHITYAPLDIETPTVEEYETESVKEELARNILQDLADINAMAKDSLNRCETKRCYRNDQALWIHNVDAQLAELTAKKPEFISGLNFLPEMTFLRVSNSQGERTIYSIIRNRAHTNVAFMFGESLRHKPENDTLTIYPGIAGSYPNFIFDVPASQISEFSQQLKSADTSKRFDSIVLQWGIRRSHPQFWEILHDFTAWQKEQQPLEAGVFDINRYENL